MSEKGGARQGSQRPLPGTVQPSRLRPKLHYELLVCGFRGHELIGIDVATIKTEDALLVVEQEGLRWYRCVRCDSWLPLSPRERPQRDSMPARDEIELPLRGRALREKVILRLIAVDRAFHFVILALLAVAIFVFAAKQSALRGPFYRVMTDLQHGIGGGPIQNDRVGILGELNKLFSLRSNTLHTVGFGVSAYALLEGIEAVGLWYQKRWAEYLTFIATVIFLPLEVYEMTHRFTPTKLVAFIINFAVAIYLIYAKRLFGLRGGAAAVRREHEEDVGWEALERATPELVRTRGSVPTAR